MRSVKKVNDLNLNHTVIQGVTSVQNNITGEIIQPTQRVKKRKLNNSGRRGCKSCGQR